MSNEIEISHRALALDAVHSLLNDKLNEVISEMLESDPRAPVPEIAAKAGIAVFLLRKTAEWLESLPADLCPPINADAEGDKFVDEVMSMADKRKAKP